jgi:hypothetical protein
MEDSTGSHDPWCICQEGDNDALENPPCDCPVRNGPDAVPALTPDAMCCSVDDREAPKG